MDETGNLRKQLFKQVKNGTPLKNGQIQIEVQAPTQKNNSVLERSSIFCSSESRCLKKAGEWKLRVYKLKLVPLIIVWVICSYCLMSNNEKVQDMHQISIQKNCINSYVIFKNPTTHKLNVILEGALLPTYYRNLTNEWLSVWVQLLVVKKMPKSTSDIKSSDVVLLQNVSDVWNVPLVTEKLIGVVPEVESQHTFHLTSNKIDNSSFNLLRLQFTSNLKTNLPVLMGYNLHPINPDNGIIYAALVLTGLYVLIIFEIVHRTLAAMLASTISVAILAVLNARPTLAEIISWIDIETLLLLFSMMTIVTIFSETGALDYIGQWAFKITGGRLWPLIQILCVIVSIMACFLDSVTTTLLITPVTIKLCEKMKLNPVPVLMIILIFSNIGGAITPIGDPPNVIIGSNPDVIKSGVNFATFTLHMGVGTAIAFFVVFIQLRLVYQDESYFKCSEESIEVQDLRREIAVWQRTAASMSSYNKEEEAVKESLIKKTEALQGILKVTKSTSTPIKDDNLLNNINTQNNDVPRSIQNEGGVIKNKVLLVKSGVTLAFVVVVLFLHSIPSMSGLGMGWTSLLGALLLLLLYTEEEIEGVLARVEWSTLLFFASLFVLMEALSKLGLIHYIGKQTENVILSVGPDARLAVAIILILWVSAVASAFVDNLPLTTMMVKIATDLAKNSELNLPLHPLIWALSFGACFGGNGSLLGSSANIICAGLAEQHGYKFSFVNFMKIGIPVTITSLIIVNVYLIICHVCLAWH